MMVRKSIAILMQVVLIGVASGQNNFKITNYFSASYRDFPMTRISIVPPQGFIKDTSEAGFISKSNNASIRAVEIKQNVDSVFTSFFSGIDSTGRFGTYTIGILNTMTGPVDLREVYDWKINGFNAHLLKVFEYTGGEKYFVWILFIGDSSTTYMINGFFPQQKQKELDKDIRASLLSVFYEPGRRILPPGADPTTTGSSACNCHDKKQ